MEHCDVASVDEKCGRSRERFVRSYSFTIRAQGIGKETPKLLGIIRAGNLVSRPFGFLAARAIAFLYHSVNLRCSAGLAGH